MIIDDKQLIENFTNEFTKVVSEVSGLKSQVISDIQDIKAVQNIHTEEIQSIKETVFDGLKANVSTLVEKVDEQVTFCRNIQEEKNQKEMNELQDKILKQEKIIKNGFERRKEGKEKVSDRWKQMPLLQKFALIAVVLTFFLKDEIKQIIVAIFNAFTGLDLGN